MIAEMTKQTPMKSPDDKFRFACTACGNCCYDPEGIILSASDIYRGAKFLGISAEDFVSKYCRMYIGQHSHLPLLTVKLEGTRKKCIFLSSNRCTIHLAKPGVCETYPLGRGLSKENNDAVDYYLSPVTCGKRNKATTVREWLSTTGVDKSNELFVAWYAKTRELYTFTDRLHSTLGDKGIALMGPDIATVLYCNYDTEKDFMPQFNANCQMLIDYLKEVEAFIAESTTALEEQQDRI